MRITRSWVGILLALASAPAVGAQTPAPYGVAVYRTQAGTTVFVPIPTRTTLAVQTSVSVPDGGTATLGGYSRLSEGRSEYGAPGLGKIPYAGRGFRNTGYGRSAVNQRAGVSVRIIDLRDEEYRQTGFRSP
jgi:type II secretory pathway component GspD/PulD (secretin)